MGSGPLRAGEVFLFMFFWPVAALYTSCMRCGLSALFNIFSALAYQKKNEDIPRYLEFRIVIHATKRVAHIIYKLIADDLKNFRPIGLVEWFVQAHCQDVG